MVKISNQPMSALKSESALSQRGNVMEQYIFLLIKSSDSEILLKPMTPTFSPTYPFCQEGVMHLEINKLDSGPIRKIMILKEIPQEENNLETECLLQNIPVQLPAFSQSCAISCTQKLSLRPSCETA